MPDVTQLAEDVLQEVERDLLGVGDPLRLDRLLVWCRGEFDRGADRVIGFGGDAHVAILTPQLGVKP